jgi:hypothetical protein
VAVPVSNRPDQMSTTEAQRMQLDAPQTQLYRLQAQNRKLRYAMHSLEWAQLVDVEEELAHTSEENVCLAEQVSKLSRNQE